MKTLDDFFKKNEPKRRVSKLKKFETEILELYKKGYRVQQIQEFLLKNDVSVTIDTINKFKRNLSKKNSSLKIPKNQNKEQNKTKIEDEKEHKATSAFFANLDKYQK